MAQLANGNDVVTPTTADAALVREVGQKLAAHPAGELRLELKTESSTEELVLPDAHCVCSCGPWSRWARGMR
jgi:hypothetical protein